MAVQDPPPPPPQQPPTHPQVQRLIDAAQVGATVQAAGAATVAPGVAVALPAVAAAGIVSAGAEGLAHAVKIALVLRVLRRLLRQRRTESASKLEIELRRRFPELDDTVIRRIIEQELKYEEAFGRKAEKRVDADLQKAGQLDKDAQKKRIAEIIAREKHYTALREQAMWDRAIGHAENERVRLQSPLGAKWVLGAAKNHTAGCLALAGKNWPWAVLDTIPPPIHTGCKCSLQPLGPTDTVPPDGEAMAAARRAMALEEAVRAVADPGEIDAYFAGEEIRPSIERALERISGEVFHQGEWLTLAEAQAPPTGTMVALYPTSAVAHKLALKGGEPVDEIHLTLAFLGKADKLPDPDGLKQAVADWAARTPPLDGEIAGHGLFTAGPEPVTYVSPDLPGLPEARDDLVDALDAGDHPLSKDHGFTPHMTIAYTDRTKDLPDHGGRRIGFNKASLVVGGERHDFKLAGKLQEASYQEVEHPRGRGGRWVAIGTRFKRGGRGGGTGEVVGLADDPDYYRVRNVVNAGKPDERLAQSVYAVHKEGVHAAVGKAGWKGKLGGERIEVKGEKKLTTPQVHAAVRKVAQGLVDFYGGDKADVEAHHEPEYMADVGGVARFRHPGELMAGINYGQGVMDNVRDPDFGTHNLRIVAHEAAHSLSGTRPGPLPGFSQTFEEGGAEILSLWFWHHRMQPLDHRDAVRAGGKWTAPGADTLAHSVVYRDYVDEFMRRAASKVGWDRTAIVDEVERVMRGDHTVRLHFRDETDPKFPLPKDLPAHMGRTSGNEDATDRAPELVKWLISEPAKLTSSDRPGETQSGGAAGSGGGRRGDLVRFGEVDVQTPAGRERYLAGLQANPQAGFISDPGEELAGKRAFLSADGNVGVTISGSGEVGNLFRNEGAPPGSGGAAVDHAVANGGTWLNAFDGALPKIYAKHGFVEVARLRWDPGQEPDAWNRKKYDSPDVVFMRHGGTARPGNYVQSWDDAEALASDKPSPPSLGGDWKGNDAAMADVQRALKAVSDRYDVPIKHVNIDKDATDDVGRFAGKSNDTIYLSPRAVDDDWMANRKKDFRGIFVDVPNDRVGLVRTVTHEFGHILDGELLHDHKAAYKKLTAFLNEPGSYGMPGTRTRLQAGLEAPSPYGTENRYEFVAEALTDWIHNGEKAHPSSQFIGKLFDEYLGHKGKLEESFFDAVLHPRGRRGQWVDAINHAETAHPEPMAHEDFTGEDFAQALSGFSHGGITAMRGNRTDVQNLYGDVWLHLHRPGQPSPVGLVRVVLKPPDHRGVRTAIIENTFLRESEQNRGFGRAFTDHLFQTLKDGHVDRIALEAISVGGYSWARRGFVWDGDHAAEQRRILQDAKNDGRWDRIKDWPGADELERKLLAGEFSSEAELAAYGQSRWTEVAQPQDQMRGYTQPERERTRLGKELLIGSRWKGSRPVVVAGALQEAWTENLHARNRLGRFQEMLGDRLEYREHHHSEASNENGKIVIGRKFLDLPDANQDFVIAHELGHNVDDALLSDPKTAWVWKDESWADKDGTPLGGPQQTPGERIADAYGVAYTGDLESAHRWPAILHVAAEAKVRGMPIDPKIDALLKDRPPVPTGPVREQRHIRGKTPTSTAFTADDAEALPADKLDAYKAILDHSGLSWSKDAATHREGGKLVVGSAFLDASPAERRSMVGALQETRLLQERAEETHLTWDPIKHRRGWHGHFADMLKELPKPSLRGRGGGRISMPDGHHVSRTRHGYEVTRPSGTKLSYDTAEEAAKSVHDEYESARLEAEVKAEREASRRERMERERRKREEEIAEASKHPWYRFESPEIAHKLVADAAEGKGELWGLPGYQNRGNAAVRAQPRRPDDETIRHERANGRVLIEFHTKVTPDAGLDDNQPQHEWTPTASVQNRNAQRLDLQDLRLEEEKETKYGRSEVAKLRIHGVRIVDVGG